MTKKILIVDDEVDLTFLMEDILTRTGGYDVIVRNDGDSGLLACNEEKPDVIMLDYVMPGCHGNKVAAIVKGTEATKHIPIIMTSGLGGLICFGKGGAWDAFQKQIDQAASPIPGGLLEWHQLSSDIAEALCFDYYFPKPFSWDSLLGIMKHILVEDNNGADRPAPKEADVPDTDEKKTVLIVEDEKETAAAMKRSLERSGYRVCALVTSGEEALIQAELLKPDVILMDIELEGTADGLRAGKEIKKRFNIPSVYMTGHEDRAVAVERFGRQPLRKPFGREELCAAIGALLYRPQE